MMLCQWLTSGEPARFMTSARPSLTTKTTFDDWAAASVFRPGFEPWQLGLVYDPDGTASPQAPHHHLVLTQGQVAAARAAAFSIPPKRKRPSKLAGSRYRPTAQGADRPDPEALTR
jgi:hypothetical protein